MKKLLLFTSAICLLTSYMAFGQYTKLLDFAGATNGNNPRSDLMQASDGMLYGMIHGGGANMHGVLFQYNPATSTYTKKLDFAGITNGDTPMGDLMQASDGMLYGMTANGGANNYGVLFQYNPATSTYTKKLDFAGATNGSNPNGTLMQASDGMLYGMTEQGGANNLGVLFQYNPATNTYTKKLDFAGAANGGMPYGSLMQASDGMLYGMTNIGGVNNYGVLFQYNPATSAYTKKLDFAGAANGQNPFGSLMQASNGMLYGMTEQGGANGFGVLFHYNPVTNILIDKLDFAGAPNGHNPTGSLIQTSDGMLYGMTPQGGANGFGVLFHYNPATSVYTKNIDIAGATNGSNPGGTLMQASDGILYGMTENGGANGMGVLFKCSTLSVSAAMIGAPICSNKCNGSANVNASGGTLPYTYLWSNGATTSTATGLCAQTYTVTVTDNIGSNASTTVAITPLPQPAAPAICAVTVDSLSLYNNIFWDKTSYINSSADSFIVYRYDVISTHYLRIGAVSKNSLSMFADTAFSIGGPNGGNPKFSSWKYRLAARDTCGNISAKSPCVKSIFIQANGANFSWTAYIDSSNVNLPTGYSFKRDDNNTGNWHILANVASTSTTDPNYAGYPNGNWRVDALGFNCTATIVNPKDPSINSIALNSSRSNVYRVGAGGVNEINNAIKISIFPNPTSGAFQIQMDNGKLSIENYQLAIYNVLGECIYQHTGSSSNLQIDLSEAKNGIYFLQLKTEQGVATKKLVINK